MNSKSNSKWVDDKLVDVNVLHSFVFNTWLSLMSPVHFFLFVISPTRFPRVWRLDRMGVYNSRDVVHQLNRSLEEASSSLKQLQQLHWLDSR